MMPLPPPLALLQIKKSAARVLADHKLPFNLDPADLVVRPDFIYEPSWSTAVSDALLERMFPSLGATELVHFTKPHLLPDILKSRQLWLAAVSKNFDAEYKAFLAEHNYTAASAKIRRELAGAFFYASFTTPGSPSEDILWREFADLGTGYRLRFRLTPRAAELRAIRYQSTGNSLLTALDEDLIAATGRRFFPRGVARITAFSLRKSLAHEGETRLLVPNPPQAARFSHSGDFIALQMGPNTNPWCQIELLGVTCGQAADVPKITALAQSLGYSALTIDAR